MKLSILLILMLTTVLSVQSQDNIQNSLGIVFSFEHSEKKPGLDAGKQYMATGIEYSNRFNQIGFRSGFIISKKFRFSDPSEFVFFPIDGDDFDGEVSSRYLEIPLSMQYYPKWLGNRIIQAYFSMGVNGAFTQDKLTGNSFKTLFDDTTFRHISGLGLILYLGKICSIDVQGFLKTPLYLSDNKSISRGKIHGLQTSLNYIF